MHKTIIILATVGALVCLPACKKAESGYQKESAGEPAAGVDAVEGYKSIKVGMQVAEIQSRLGETLSYKDLPLPPPENDWDSTTHHQLAQLAADEKEWGGVAVTNVRVHVTEGVVNCVVVSLVYSDVFLKALTKKYGEPGRTLSGSVWQGSNTIMRYCPMQKGVEVRISRQSVDEQLKAARKQKSKAKKAQKDAEAAEASKKL